LIFTFFYGNFLFFFLLFEIKIKGGQDLGSLFCQSITPLWNNKPFREFYFGFRISDFGKIDVYKFPSLEGCPKGGVVIPHSGMFDLFGHAGLITNYVSYSFRPPPSAFRLFSFRLSIFLFIFVIVLVPENYR